MLPATLLLLFSTPQEPARALREVEAKFLRLPDPASCERFLQILTEDPRLAGTPGDRRAAEYTRSRWLEYGLEADLATYEVYLPYPKSVEVKLLAPEEYKVKNVEEGWAWDKDSYAPDAVLPFNAYSPSGDVTAELVYANYGLPEDFAKLKAMGVDPAGKIAVARYGRSYRGIKARAAQESGAVGLILFSDPADDGYGKGDPYPRGPWRAATSLQRGSILDLAKGPGDPLSPGWAAIKGARRIEPSQSEALPRIPTTPISHGDAAPLLRSLAGPPVPEGWQGGLPFAYHLGPGPARANLKLEIEAADRPIWDVIGRIPGAARPEEWVILGAHRDAWVHGAVDDGSGCAVLLEVGRCLGELLKGGWRPARTILLASWDGEEFGLLGSTEWVEERVEELGAKGVAYLNADSAVSGRDFAASGSPSLADFARAIAKAVEDPRARAPIHDLWAERTKGGIKEEEAYRRGEEPDRGASGTEPPVGTLGSGSDYTAFLDHAGVACLDFTFQGPYGPYHSTHDDFYWMKNFGDPTFEVHATMARVMGLAAIRLADADLLPVDHAAVARAVPRYLEGIEGKAKKAGESRGEKPPALEAPLRRVREAAEALATAAASARERGAAAARKGDAAALAEVNAALLRAEREFLDRAGVPGRPWFRSLLQAPGLDAGYAPATLPGIREAAIAGEADRVAVEAGRVAARLEGARAVLLGKTAPAPQSGRGGAPDAGRR
ncbi:MAG TPA: M28 family metallopeptidase [Planctomycetota bacterium]|jgi:N-acetylated-alpha-linked acidic dipeptidase|nr:M28 family metallopeptidase [Planctomycetota bacterium]